VCVVDDVQAIFGIENEIGDTGDGNMPSDLMRKTSAGNCHLCTCICKQLVFCFYQEHSACAESMGVQPVPPKYPVSGAD